MTERRFANKMRFKYNPKKHNTITYTILTIFIICVVFAGSVLTSRYKAQEEAYDTLRIQTQQIKDDLALQINSDIENLVTMASFASKLYERGEDYSLMFDSFKPIGLFSKIGILSPDGTFTTKFDSVDLNGKVSFENEVAKGQHITDRTFSYSNPEEEVIRSAVPIRANGEVVGIIYGIIRPDTLEGKYHTLITDLDANLVIYDKTSHRIIVDTDNKDGGDMSRFEDRKYNTGFSYERLIASDNGFLSFKSPDGGDIYAYFSTVSELKWGVILARHESQVFGEANRITNNLVTSFMIMLLAVAIYLYLIIYTEKSRTKIATETSDIRKLLLSVNKKHKNIDEALKRVKTALGARAAFYIDTDGIDYNDSLSETGTQNLMGEDRKYFIGELFRVAEKNKNDFTSEINFVYFEANQKLKKTDEGLYDFLLEHGINEIAFAIISEGNNHTSILGVTNPHQKELTKTILEDTAICFSIAIYNNKNLDNTEREATTDALTGLLNRVAFNKAVIDLDRELPKDFSCIYVDVNELNLINNKHGHMAGDEMLVCIADTLKEVFGDRLVYRMGGDEFLVFLEGVKESRVKKKTKIFLELIKEKGYSAALGVSYKEQSSGCVEMVREAEVRMYEAKAQFYQAKKSGSISDDRNDGFVQINTGIKEIDTVISLLKEQYYGIFKVSLKDDTFHSVLAFKHFGYNENEAHFSKILMKYIDDIVHPEYSRLLMSFLNSNALKHRMAEGENPFASFETLSGEKVNLTVYNLSDEKGETDDTLWVFARE